MGFSRKVRIVKAFFARLRFGMTSHLFKGHRLKMWRWMFEEYYDGD